MARALGFAVAAVGVAAGMYLVTTCGAKTKRADDQGAKPVFAEARPVFAADRPAAAVAEAPTSVRRIDGSRRQELLEQLERARSTREARPAEAAEPRNGTDWVPAPSLPPGTLDKDKVRATVKEAIPLLMECYQQELEETPDFSGRLELTMTVAGEPEVGGLVEEVTVASADGMATRPAFAQCVRETMLSLEFPPPDSGGKVEIRYPFQFTHD